MRRLGAISRRAQLAVSFLLFALTALVLLAYPHGEPVEIVRRGLTHPQAAGVYERLGTGIAAGLICLGSFILLGRQANSPSGSLRQVMTRYLLLVFLAFFAAERLAERAAVWLHLRGSLQEIQILSSIGAVLVATLVLPRLRSMREGLATGQKEHARFLAAAESTLDDFYIFDGVRDSSGQVVDFRFSYINPNAERRLHARREELLGRILTEVRPFMISSGLIEKYREVVRTGEPYTCEVFIDDEMIHATWLNVQVVKLGDGIAITSRDVTERRRLTERVQHLAHHDQLTGLANRTLLQDRLQQAILRAQRNHERVAVFMLDIDRFKEINDSMGHSNGDALLAEVGQRLLVSVRETDTVARIGGDEFVIVMPGFRDLRDVERCGRLLIDNAAKPILLDDREITITVSVGACICPESGVDTNELLRKADAAMYTVKDSGRNGFRIFRENPGECEAKFAGMEISPCA